MTTYGSLRRTDWVLFVLAVAVAFTAFVWRQGVPSGVNAFFVVLVLVMGSGILLVGSRLADRRA